MNLITTLQIFNLLLLIIIAVLLFINRKAENQTKMRLAFLILLVLFILEVFMF